MIKLENISYSAENSGVKSRILDGLSLDIVRGKYVVITGPNGGGKTSLARVIMGIYTPDEGRVLLDGEDITPLSVTERAKLGFGFGFQHPPRFKGMAVKDILEIAAGRQLRHSEVCELLTQVGLCATDYASREVDTSLSGGELKRIEIASVLATDSSVMIFDEPEAGIDLWSFHRLTKTFRNHHEKSGSTLIIISHQERIIEQADEVVLVADGKVSGRGTPEEILPSIGGFAEKTCWKATESERDYKFEG